MPLSRDLSACCSSRRPTQTLGDSGVAAVTIFGVEGSEAPLDKGSATAAALGEGDRLFRAGDRGGAEVQYRRADELGSARGAGALAWVLRARGAVGVAEEAARRADERGDARGALILGLLLAWREAFVDAEAALRRAEERGDWLASVSLGVLLRVRGDEDGAVAAFERAQSGRDGGELGGGWSRPHCPWRHRRRRGRVASGGGSGRRARGVRPWEAALRPRRRGRCRGRVASGRRARSRRGGSATRPAARGAS
jgi:hypothetical protein